MQPGRIAGHTNVLKAPAGHDQSKLRISELAIKVERVASGICATSAWTPSPAELERLNAGASVYLSIFADVHPAVALHVGAAPPAGETTGEKIEAPVIQIDAKRDRI